MAWTAPRTWVTSEVVTSSQLNTHLRDNLGFLFDSEIGVPKPFCGVTLPANHQLCDGTAYSKTTYATLWGRLSLSLGTVTISIASPGVVTKTSHGLLGYERVHLTTTGALPTGLSANTDYWVIYVDVNTFRLATSLDNALAGTAINTSGSQSGTHTCIFAPWGVSGSSNFLIPDLRGRLLVGAAGSGGKAEVRVVGESDSVAQASRSVQHGHTGTVSTRSTTGAAGTIMASIASADVANQTNTGVSVGDTNNPNNPAYGVIQWMMRVI